jgi:phosphoglycolate phosphatase-like HAD superfamily hydrolase
MNIVWFDFDGTIVDVQERFYHVHIAICSELGILSLSKNDYWQARCNAVSTKDILKLLNATDLFEQYISIRNNLIESVEFLKYDRLREGVKETLSEVDISYKSNLLTARSNKDSLFSELENLNIRQYFSDIFMVSPFSKWEEKSVVLDKFSNESHFIIGDTPNDIIAGKKASIKTVGILNGMSTPALLTSSNPDLLIKEFSEIKKIL